MRANTLDYIPPPGFGVLFAEDFDVPDLPDRHEAVTVAPRINDPEPAVDVEAVRREAFALGRASATAEIDADQARRDDATRALLERIVIELGRGVAEYGRVAEAGADAVAKLVLGMLAAALPALCARHGAAEAAAVARDVLPALSHVPKVLIRVNPDVLAFLQAELARLDPEFQGRIAILPSEAIPAGDLRVSWQDGCATRETARIWQSIGETMASLGLIDAPLPADAHPVCDALRKG